MGRHLQDQSGRDGRSLGPRCARPRQWPSGSEGMVLLQGSKYANMILGQGASTWTNKWFCRHELNCIRRMMGWQNSEHFSWEAGLAIACVMRSSWRRRRVGWPPRDIGKRPWWRIGQSRLETLTHHRGRSRVSLWVTWCEFLSHVVVVAQSAPASPPPCPDSLSCPRSSITSFFVSTVLPSWPPVAGGGRRGPKRTLYLPCFGFAPYSPHAAVFPAGIAADDVPHLR